MFAQFQENSHGTNLLRKEHISKRQLRAHIYIYTYIYIHIYIYIHVHMSIDCFAMAWAK